MILHYCKSNKIGTVPVEAVPVLTAGRIFKKIKDNKRAIDDNVVLATQSFIPSLIVQGYNLKRSIHSVDDGDQEYEVQKFIDFTASTLSATTCSPKYRCVLFPRSYSKLNA